MRLKPNKQANAKKNTQIVALRNSPAVPVSLFGEGLATQTRELWSAGACGFHLEDQFRFREPPCSESQATQGRGRGTVSRISAWTRDPKSAFDPSRPPPVDKASSSVNHGSTSESSLPTPFPQCRSLIKIVYLTCD